MFKKANTFYKNYSITQNSYTSFNKKKNIQKNFHIQIFLFQKKTTTKNNIQISIGPTKKMK